MITGPRPQIPSLVSGPGNFRGRSTVLSLVLLKVLPRSCPERGYTMSFLGGMSQNLGQRLSPVTGQAGNTPHTLQEGTLHHREPGRLHGAGAMPFMFTQEDFHVLVLFLKQTLDNMCETETLKLYFI